MRLEYRTLAEWQVLTPDVDRLDAHVSESFRDELIAAIERGPHQIVLDLSGVEFMDSSGLGAIVYTLQRLDEGGRIAVAGPQETVSLMLQLTHMDRVFTVVKQPEDLVTEKV